MKKEKKPFIIGKDIFVRSIECYRYKNTEHQLSGVWISINYTTDPSLEVGLVGSGMMATLNENYDVIQYAYTR